MADIDAITDADRETAALICAIAASTPDLHNSYGRVLASTGIEPGSTAANLAYDAWFESDRNVGYQVPDVRDAEAEALIRSGWSPS